jgi:hypothetical protein
MMIKFSWKKINNKFGWNAQSVIQYFYCKRGIKPQFYLGPIKKNVIAEASKPWPTGYCYLVNVDEVLRMAQDPNYLYYYLELASKRDLFDYKMRAVVYLRVQFVPEYLMGLVDMNPMLEIRDDKIYFKYEQR